MKSKEQLQKEAFIEIRILMETPPCDPLIETLDLIFPQDLMIDDEENLEEKP